MARHDWRTLLLPLALSLGACASAPKPLAGDYSAVEPLQASEEHRGQTVRWGGQIVSTTPQAEQTCMEILGRALDPRARPRRGDRSTGRFLACHQGFRDPAVFAAGRQVTVIGQLSGFSERMIGDYRYRYPEIASQTLYLWPEVDASHVQAHHPAFLPPWWAYRWPYSGRLYHPRW